LGVEVGRLDHRLNQVAAATGAQNLSDAAQNALLNPQSQKILLNGPGPNAPVLAEVVAGSPNTAFLFNRGLPALPAARTYQLWLTGQGRAISMGLLGANPRTVAFALGPTLGPTVPSKGFAVTVEPVHGSVVPTLPIVASGQARPVTHRNQPGSRIIDCGIATMNPRRSPARRDATRAGKEAKGEPRRAHSPLRYRRCA
jgi:hypothetical protein